MIDLNNQIKDICRAAYKPLEDIYQKGIREPFVFDLDLSTIRDYNNEDIRYSVEHEELFKKLLTIKGPVLYWFEIIGEHDSHALLDAFNSYRQSPNCKAIPALKVRPNHDSSILYVGKVKNNFWGRVIQHLGFYKVTRTQGLQLYHWAKPLGLKLKVHAMQFEPEMANLMPIVENGLAAHLKPLLGKHK